MKTPLFPVYTALIAIAITACSHTSDVKNKITLTNTSVAYTDMAYQLNWQTQPAAGKVDILVGETTDLAKARLLADDISSGQYHWTPDNNHQRYYFFIQPEGGQPILTTSRLIPLEGGRNFRDLGGYQTTDGHSVKWGKIFRSGVLNSLTEADYQLIDELNIGTIVDFRSNSERNTEVTNWHTTAVEQINENYELNINTAEFAQVFSSPDLTKDKVEALMLSMYPELLDAQKQNYIAMFDRLLEKDQALLFHCTAGKDRTGISALLVLTALGVDKQTAIDDYMASNQYLDFKSLLPKDAGDVDPKQAAMMKMLARLPADVMQPIMGVTQPLIESTIAKMEAEHGTILNYIKQELKVSDQDIQRLRAKYLE